MTHIAISNRDVINHIKLACLRGEWKEGFRIERRNPKVIQLSSGIPNVRVGGTFKMNDSLFRLLGRSKDQLLIVEAE